MGGGPRGRAVGVARVWARLRDETEEALGLPGGKYEVPLVLFDRLFDQEGQL